MKRLLMILAPTTSASKARTKLHIKVGKWVAIMMVVAIIAIGVAQAATKIMIPDDEDDFISKSVSGNQMQLPNGDLLLVEDGTDLVYE